jgi:hypothetical protein
MPNRPPMLKVMMIPAIMIIAGIAVASREIARP